MIKLAMPRVQKFLLDEGLKTKILLQVHDELLFESPNNEVEIVKDKVSEIMIRSHENYLALSVPIKVDVGVGESWDDAH